jgi:cellulose synthase/poly-beta-1,6-N-acetylglucosamine synthase-like glycosyltransferase
LLLFLLSLSLIANVLYSLKLRQAVEEAPTIQLKPRAAPHPPNSGGLPDQSPPELGDLGGGSFGLLPTLTVIIPAYNEAENIADCVSSVLNSASPSELLELWVVDDQSIDATWEILQTLQSRLNDPRLKLLAGQPRPAGEVWMGKNWACVQAAERAKGDYLLFLDADLRLNQGAIATTLQFAHHHQTALFTLCPTVVCDCMAEWLAQPLIIHTMMIGFNFKAVNDPTTDAAFAAGMFMLFQRAAYEQVGGHRAVAAQVVEDVELGRLVKYSGLKLQCLLGREIASVRMYRTWAALWEGWTKNLYSGGQRNPVSMAKFVLVILLMCVMPWVGLFLALGQVAIGKGSIWNGIALALSVLAITMNYVIRRIGTPASGITPRYWWLTGLGGLFVAAIGLASVLKTETGWGWTWRGRSLKQQP